MNDDKCHHCGSDVAVIAAGEWGDRYECGRYFRGPQTPECQLRQLRQRVAELEARLADTSPGTPLGRLEGIAQFAIDHCGFNEFDSRPPELAIFERVVELERRLAEATVKAAERDAEVYETTGANAERDEYKSALSRIAASLGLPEGAEVEEVAKTACALLDNLPKTADGAHVFPGMVLWDVANNETHYAWRFVRLGRGVLGIETCEEKIALELLYSSQEAMEAADAAEAAAESAHDGETKE